MSDKSEPLSLELITGIMNELAQLVDDKKLTWGARKCQEKPNSLI
jgi:hypothetical protein